MKSYRTRHFSRVASALFLSVCIVTNIQHVVAEESPPVLKTPQQQSDSVAELSWDKKIQLPVTLEIIDIFKNRRWEDLANNARYPIKLSHPIDPIQDEADFVNRINLIFDEQTIEEIANSNPISDWSLMGSQGIMFKNGDVWVTEGGRLLAVNRDSSNLKDLIAKLSGQDIAQLVFNYQYPLVRAQVHQFKNRQYRLSLWLKGSDLEQEPDYVLTNGRIDKHVDFVFIKDDYTISLEANGFNPDWPASISIYDSDDEYFSDGTLSQDTIKCCAAYWQDFLQRDEQKELANLKSILDKATAKQVVVDNEEIIASAQTEDTGLMSEFVFPRFTVQIEKLDTGLYQYKSWSKSKSTTETPDLVLKNGELDELGTYRFKNGKYSYEVSQNTTDSDWRAMLQVIKGGKAIFVDKLKRDE